MAVRSTTSSNQPPPPFYTIPSGAHRNVHLGSESARRGEPVSVNMALGRQVDSAIDTGTTTSLPVQVTQHIIGLQLSPRL